MEETNVTLYTPDITKSDDVIPLAHTSSPARVSAHGGGDRVLRPWLARMRRILQCSFRSRSAERGFGEAENSKLGSVPSGVAMPAISLYCGANDQPRSWVGTNAFMQGVARCELERLQWVQNSRADVVIRSLPFPRMLHPSFSLFTVFPSKLE